MSMGEEFCRKVTRILIGIFLVVYRYAEAFLRLLVPPSMKSIDGETILITGAAGAIGKEICRNLVKSGKDIKLVLWDINKSELDKFVIELKSLRTPGLQVHSYTIDISSRTQIESGCAQVINDVGHPTIIFNNAGVVSFGNFLQLTNEEIEQTMNVNVMSHFWILRQFLPDMVANNYGHIINTCSMAGLKALANSFPYIASKFAMHGYTEALKAELRLPHYKLDGIKFTTVFPYFVQTSFIGSFALHPKRTFKLPFRLEEFLTPEEVGEKMVNGMRREYEYIYLPFAVPWLSFCEYVMPLKLWRAFDALYSNRETVYLQDPKEYERILNLPYLVAAANPSSAHGVTYKK